MARGQGPTQGAWLGAFVRRSFPGRSLALAACVWAIATGCAGWPSRSIVRPNEASYCPCSQVPECPVKGLEHCSLGEIQRQQPSASVPFALTGNVLPFLGLAERCGNYYRVTASLELSFVDYLFDARTGVLAASAEVTGDGDYRVLPDGRLAPQCRCLGSPDLRVGVAIDPSVRCERPDPAELARIGVNPDGVGQPALERSEPSSDAGAAGRSRHL
jgi:hypothetical protein